MPRLLTPGSRLRQVGPSRGIGSSGSLLQAVPALAANHTLVWREEWGVTGHTDAANSGTVLQSGSAGTLTTFPTGKVTGRLPGGPTWMDGTTRKSGSAAIEDFIAPFPADATVQLECTRTWTALQYGSFTQSFKARAGMSVGTGANAVTLFRLDGDPVAGWFVNVALSPAASPTSPVSRYKVHADGLPLSNTVEVAADQPFQVKVTWQGTAGANVIRVWVKTDGAASWVKTNDYSDSSATPYQFAQVRYRYVRSSGRDVFAGRMGPAAVFSLPSIAAGDAQDAPGGELWWAEPKTTWTIDPTSGTAFGDSNLRGPWQTWADMHEAMRRNVIQGARIDKPFVRNGSPYGWADVANSDANAEQFARDVFSGLVSQGGDVVVFAGTIRDTLDRQPRADRAGLKYTRTNGAVIRRTRQMAAAGWAQTSSSPNVWAYSGGGSWNLRHRCVWTSDGRAFTPQATLAALNSGTWRQFTDDSTGVTSISLPLGDSPTTYGGLEGSQGIDGVVNPNQLNWDGCFVRDLETDGGMVYSFGTANDVEKAYDVGVGNSIATVTVVWGFRATRWGKHAVGRTHTPADTGLFVLADLDAPLSPNVGGYSTYAEYTSAVTSAISPGTGISILVNMIDPGSQATQVAGLSTGTTLDVANVPFLGHAGGLKAFQYTVHVGTWAQFMGNTLGLGQYPPLIEYGDVSTGAYHVRLAQRAAL